MIHFRWFVCEKSLGIRVNSWCCETHVGDITPFNFSHCVQGHAVFICVPWLIRESENPHLYVQHNSVICAPWLIYMCTMTQLYVWLDTFTRVIRLICKCYMTHLYMRHPACALARACTRRRASECTCARIWKQTSARDKVTPANTRKRQSNTQTHTHIHKHTHSHTWTRARRTQRMSCSSSFAFGVTVRALSKCVSCKYVTRLRFTHILWYDSTSHITFCQKYVWQWGMSHIHEKHI